VVVDEVGEEAARGWGGGGGAGKGEFGVDAGGFGVVEAADDADVPGMLAFRRRSWILAL